MDRIDEIYLRLAEIDAERRRLKDELKSERLKLFKEGQLMINVDNDRKAMDYIKYAGDKFYIVSVSFPKMNDYYEMYIDIRATYMDDFNMLPDDMQEGDAPRFVDEIIKSGIVTKRVELLGSGNGIYDDEKLMQFTKEFIERHS